MKMKFLMLACLPLFACTKEENLGKRIDSKINEGENLYKNSPTNYDSVGFVHNELLIFYAANGNVRDSLFSDFTDLTTNYCFAKFGMSGIGDSLSHLGDFQAYLGSFRQVENQNEFETAFNELCSTLEITDSLNSKLLELAQISFEEASCQNCYVSDIVNSYEMKVDSLVQTISGLNTSESEAFKTVAALSKFSFKYWATQYTISNNPYNIPLVDEPSNLELQAPLWLAADAAGCLTGITIGAGAFGIAGIAAVGAISSAMNYR